VTPEAAAAYLGWPIGTSACSAKEISNACYLARRDHRGAPKLPAAGTTSDQLSRSVRFLEGSPPRTILDRCGTPLLVPSSSLV